MCNKSVVEIHVKAVYLAPVILYKYTRSKLENAEERSTSSAERTNQFFWVTWSPDLLVMLRHSRRSLSLINKQQQLIMNTNLNLQTTTLLQ